MPSSSLIAELRRMSAPELIRDIKLKRAECARLRIGIETQSQKNHALHRAMRRDLARMCMALKDHERGRIVASTTKSEAIAPETKTGKSSKKPSQATRKSVQGSRS